MDFDAVMGLDSAKKSRPKKSKKASSSAQPKRAKSKGLLRSLRSTKKKSIEVLLAEPKQQPMSERPTRSKSSEPLRPSLAQSGGAVETSRKGSTVEKFIQIQKCPFDADSDSVLVTTERIVSGATASAAPVMDLWPTAALRRVLESQRDLNPYRLTSQCATSESLQELVAYTLNTRDSLTRSSSEVEPDTNPYRNGPATKGSAKQSQQNKEVEKDILTRKRQLPTTMWTFVDGYRAKYFWKSIETILKHEDVRAIRIMYQRAAFGFALDQLRALSNAARELNLKVDKNSVDVAHALLRNDSSKLNNYLEDAKFIKSLSLLWHDGAIQEAFHTSNVSPQQHQICTYMLDGIERILGPKYTPQNADFQYLQYLSREKLRVIRMNHENSIYRFFGVDRVSGGSMRKWAPLAQDCVGMLVYHVDVSSIGSFNDSLQGLVETIDMIRPTLAILVFALGFAELKRQVKNGSIDLKVAFPSYSGSKFDKFVKNRINRRSPSWFTGKFQVELVDEATTYDYYGRAVKLGNQAIVAQIHEAVYELTEAI